MAWLRNSFVSGEISLALSKRTELPQRDNALLESLNTVHQPQGGVSKRPGCRKISGTEQVERLFPWYKNESEKYVVGLYHTQTQGNLQARIYDLKGNVYTAASSNLPILNEFALFLNIDVVNSGLSQAGQITVNAAQGQSNEFVIDGNTYNFVALVRSIASIPPWVHLQITYNGHQTPLPAETKLSWYRNGAQWYLDLSSPQYHGETGASYFFTAPTESWLIRNNEINPPIDKIAIYQSNVFLDNRITTASTTEDSLGENALWQNCITAQHYADTLILTCAEFPPLALTRGGTDSSPTFTLKPMAIRNPPMLKHPDTTAYNAERTRIGAAYSVDGSSGGNEKTFEWTGTALTQRDVASDEVGKRNGRYTMIWNPVDGWPATSALKDGRLVFAGSKAYPATLWYSVVGDALDFLDSTPLPDIPETTQTNESTEDDVKPDYATVRRLNAFNPIISLRSDTDMLAFTEGGEWSIEGVIDAEDVTSARARQYGHLGSQIATGTAAIDDQVFYASKNSAQGLLYDSTFRGYIPYNITAGRNERLFNNKRVIRITSAQPKNLNGSYLVFFLKGDGEIIVYHTLNKQEFMAFSRWNFSETIGRIIDVACVDDDIYLLNIEGDIYRMEAGLYQDNEMDFTTRIETCQLTHTYLRTPPEGFITIKQLLDFHITATDAKELKCTVKNASAGGDRDFEIPDNISAIDPDTEPLPGQWGRRRIVLGISDVQAAYNKGRDMTMAIESKANAPLHIDRLDIQVEYNRG